MAIDKIFNDTNIDGIADNIFNAVNNSVSEVKQMQQRKAAENVQLVVESLKKIDKDIREKFDNVTDVIEKRVLSIKDGRDGISGSDGRNGKDGKPGRDAVNGKQGVSGTSGKDGLDGKDGVSVNDAHIDFDGSLIIALSSGKQLNVGEVVSQDLAEKIQVISTMSTNAAIAVQDEGASITSGVKTLNFVGATVTASSSGDDVTVNVSAGTGTVTSVALSGGTTGLTSSGGPITTTGTLTLGGTLAVASGGTGTATPSLVAGTNITSITGTWPNQTINAGGGSGTVTSVAATVPAFLSVTGSPITTTGTLAIGLSGTALPLANGGTGNATGTATTNANLTGAVTSVGNASSLGSFTSAQLATALTDETGSGANVFATSPTLVTPALGSPSSVGTMPAFTLGGTVAGGGNQINNVIIGTTTPLAGAFTSLTASSTLGVTGVSTLTGGAVVQGLTVGLGAGAVSTNTAVGASALAANTTGSSNTVVGYQAANRNLIGTSNSVFGMNAAYWMSGSNNVVVGESALGTNNSAGTGSNNVAVGNQSLNNNAASSNTAVGYQAGYSNTTGNTISAVGYQALYSNTTGVRNVAMGSNALRANTTASDSTAFGANALSVSTGTGNTGVGSYSLFLNTTGTNNTAIGINSIGNTTTGSSNSGVGNFTLYNNSTGSTNTAIGDSALFSNTTASNNTAVGYQAAYANTTGTSNTFVGYQAGYSQTTANRNTLVGIQTGYSLTTGSGNTFIGTPGSANSAGCGYAMTTGANNTIIGGYTGNQGGLDIRTASNYIVLSDGGGNPLISTNSTRSVALNGAVPQTGTGITFPATQNASADVNTLDDYEEGTFTPTIALATPGTSTTANAVGRYTKVGNLVTVVGRIAITKGTGSGNLVLGGLPIAAVTLAGYQCSGALTTDDFGVSGKIYQIILTSNSTAPELYSVTQAGGGVVAASASDFGAGSTTIRYVLTYQTA